MTARDSAKLSVICLTSPLPAEVMLDLNEAFKLIVLPLATPVERLGAYAPDALLVTIDRRLDAGQLNALPSSVKAIATYSVGLDHIDLDTARRKGLAVFNTPGVLADSVAETALFLLLGAARRATESINLIRSRTWPGWNACQLNGMELVGKTLGIFGMGAIGRRIAARARAFGLKIAYADSCELSSELAGDATFYSDAAAMLADIDILVTAAPSTAQTRGFVNAGTLSLARPGLIIVNIARGDLVEDNDLIAALKDGRVRAAGLDVFNGEPNIDPRYFELPNVFMTPHMGSSTIEARRRMGFALIDALRAWQEGRRPLNQVC